jgi:CHAT domain-containing protein
MASITQAVNRWRQTFGASRGDEDPAGKLRRLVWVPLESRLEGAKLVLISPDEALGRLPFAALPGRMPGKYLLEERALAVVAVPHLLPELLQESEPAGSTPSLLLVGDINFDQSTPTTPARTLRAGPAKPFRPLPGSSAEIAAIQEVFRKSHRAGKVTVLRAEKANESEVCRQASAHRYLHLATHGFFVEKSSLSAIKSVPSGKPALGKKRTGQSVVVDVHPGLLSGLALAGANQPGERDNGILTALEVADLDLAGVYLVTLSACGTGLGTLNRAEGLQGLQRAFQVAGARTVIASLWDVPDQSTRLLMQRFYDNLWNKRISRLEALREAQLWMLREVSTQPEVFRGLMRGLDFLDEQEPRAGRPLSPFFWAAFVLSGDWR